MSDRYTREGYDCETVARGQKDAAHAVPMTTVYVVMSNDYPDCVFDTKLAAEAYCTLRSAEQLEKVLAGMRIYYAIHAFTVNEQGRRL